MAIYSNGIFSSGINVLFENGESAVNAAILNGGTMQIGQEGTAESVVLGSGGRLTVSSGGTAKNVSQAIGGILDFSVYGEDLATSITGTAYHGGNKFTHFSLLNGIASGFYLYAGATGQVHSGGRADSTFISSQGLLQVSSGGSGNVVNIAAGGSMAVYGGGSVNSVTVSSGGLLAVSSGAVVTGIAFASGGIMKAEVIGNDSSTVIQGNDFSLQSGIASNFTIYAGGELTLTSGGTAKNIKLMQGGTLDAGSDGIVSGLTLASGGVLKITVSSGGSGALTGSHQLGSFSVNAGVASNFVIYAAGELSLISSGIARNTTVSSGGLLVVGERGIVSGATVVSGGSLTVSNGGSATAVVLASGAVLNLDLNGSGNTGIAGSNIVYATNLSQYVYLPFEIKSSLNGGFYASGLYLYSGADVDVSSGGSAVSMAIYSGGRLTVGEGGYASGITQIAGGILDVTVRGNDSRTFVSGICSNVRFTLSRGVASNFWIYDDADFTVESGGVATGLLLYSGGRLHTTVGGNAGAKQISGNYSCDGYGGSFSLANNSANGFQIFSGCRFIVSSGGNATNLGLYQGGILQVIADGNNPRMTVTGVHHASGHSSFALTSKCASGFLIYDSGYLTVLNGVSALHTTVANGGLLTVGSQGKASATTVLAGGSCIVSSRGAMVDMTVQEGAAAMVYGGASLAGTLQIGGQIDIAGSGLIQCTDGVRLNLLVDQRSEKDASLSFVDDLSKLFGPVSITVRTSIDQALGCYILAGKAEDYNGNVTLTVVDDAGNETGIGQLSLSTGNTLYYRSSYYSLAMNANKDLCLMISLPGYDSLIYMPEVSVTCNGNDVSVEWTRGLSVAGNDNLTYEAELYLDGTLIFSKNVTSLATLNLGTLAPNYRPGSEYEFRIRTFDGDSLSGSGYGDWCTSTFTLDDYEAPETGTLQTVQNGKTVCVSWDGFADNAAIQWFDITLNNSITRRVAGSMKEYTFTVPETLYGPCEVEVTAIDYAGNSAAVSDMFYYDDFTAPEKVTLIGQTPVGAGAVELRWNEAPDAGSGVDHYLIEFGYMSATPDQMRLIAVSDAWESYVLNGIGKGDFGWRVCAVDGAGNQGEWSDSRYFRL